jgi:hypothetical protein
MAAIVAGSPTALPSEALASTPVVALKRRTVDSVLVALGAVVAIVLLVAGALLTWGSNFSNDYVYDELSTQQIFFPAEERLVEEERTDLLKYAGVQVTTGPQAEAYASYIDGHLANIADGMTYAELGAVERAAQTEVTAATEAGQSTEAVAALKAEADGISAQRNSLFKGETLRGLLLSAFAWSTVGRIAGIAATVAFVAAAAMVVLVVLGVWHLRHLRRISAAS